MGKDTESQKKRSKNSGKKKVASEQEDEEYVVEAIMDKKFEGGKPKYLVKWKDWPHSSNTWEPVTNLQGCPEILTEFEKVYQLKGSEESTKKKEMSVQKENSDSSVYDSDASGQGTIENSNSIDVDVLEECPADKEPEDLLGVVPIAGIMTYLVKWKPKGRKASGGDDQDMNLVRGDVFKTAFPHAVIAFYEKHIIWARSDQVKEELAKDAMFELDKSKAKKPDASVYPQSNPQIKISKSLTNKSAIDLSSSGSDSDVDSDEVSKMEVDPTI